MITFFAGDTVAFVVGDAIDVEDDEALDDGKGVFGWVTFTVSSIPISPKIECVKGGMLTTGLSAVELSAESRFDVLVAP